MVSFELQLNLPESIAREAEAQGLLSAEAIEGLLRAELRRRHIDQLFDAADRLAALPDPLTATEIEAEIQAVRSVTLDQAEDWQTLEQLIESSVVDTGISDLAEQHDHYLYGSPKKA